MDLEKIKNILLNSTNSRYVINYLIKFSVFNTNNGYDINYETFSTRVSIRKKLDNIIGITIYNKKFLDNHNDIFSDLYNNISYDLSLKLSKEIIHIIAILCTSFNCNTEEDVNILKDYMLKKGYIRGIIFYEGDMEPYKKTYPEAYIRIYLLKNENKYMENIERIGHIGDIGHIGHIGDIGHIGEYATQLQLECIGEYKISTQLEDIYTYFNSIRDISQERRL